MSDPSDWIKYTVVQESTDEEFGAFEGDGNVDDYDEPYRSYALAADTGARFQIDIDGTIHKGVMVRAEPCEK